MGEEGTVNKLTRNIVICIGAWIVGWTLLGCLFLATEMYYLSDGVHKGLLPVMWIIGFVTVATLGFACVVTVGTAFEWYDEAE